MRGPPVPSYQTTLNTTHFKLKSDCTPKSEGSVVVEFGIKSLDSLLATIDRLFGPVWVERRSAEIYKLILGESLSRIEDAEGLLNASGDIEWVSRSLLIQP